MLKTKLSLAIIVILTAGTVSPIYAQAAQMPSPPNGQPPAPPPNGGGQMQQQKQSATEGDWSFDIITSGNTKTATITYYAGKQNQVVAVPAILGGATVTAIAAQAFGHHAEILGLYLPSTLQTVDDWAFYDLNAAQIISFANPDVKIATGALQSSANAVIYLPEKSTISQVSGNKVVKQTTQLTGFNLKNTEAAAIAPGQYLNVDSAKNLSLNLATLKQIAQSASHQAQDVVAQDQTLTFKGENYKVTEQKVQIAKVLQQQVQAADLNSTFKGYSKESAVQFNQQLTQDKAYADVVEFLKVQSGYYLNGHQVELDSNVQAFDVQTGKRIEVDKKTGLFPSTGQGQYKYVAWKDTNRNGKIDRLYYSPFNINYQYQDVSIESQNSNLNQLKARDQLNPQYLAFANAVVEANGKDQQVHKAYLNVKTAQDGDAILAKANKNRSILWANHYGTIQVDDLQAYSNAIGDWAGMSSELGLSSPNTEIVMEWGMNALLYATNGGQIVVGNLQGKTSQFYANGDGANGVIAGAAGSKSGSEKGRPSTSSVTVKNAHFQLEGWNNHVADTVYGGYANLEKVTSTTGKLGSYAVGQASALANDFGNGVVDAVDFHTTVYGNRSAGGYVIGGGVITAKNSSFVSKMDAGLVIASGGTYKVQNSTVEGQIAIRNRGGVVADSASTFDNVQLTVNRDLNHYVTGAQAQQAVDAWKQATGQASLASVLMSRQGYTITDLAQHYGLNAAKTQKLLTDLSKIAKVDYNAKTLLRNSVLDNTFYNYSAGAYTGTTDFADVPYLTVGSAFGGLVSSIFEFENAGTTLNLNSIKTIYHSDIAYQYLLASEAGSAPVVNIQNSQVNGLVWNEGNVTRVVEGQPGQRSSSFQINFDRSQFTGSFADGNLGLWNAASSYKTGAGKPSQLNGNYYQGQTNWQGKASFKNSTWYITHDAYLGELQIDAATQVVAPKNTQIIFKVNGKVQKLAAGKYQGKIELLLNKQ